MDLTAANHYVVDGIVTGTIDTAGITGEPVLSLRFGDDELRDARLSEAVVGIATVTTTRTSIGGPRLVEGPLQRYEVHPVGGMASVIES